MKYLEFSVTLDCFQLGTEVKAKFWILTNSTLKTFYIWLYGIRRMVKDHSDNERGPHGLLFPISSKGSFICIITHSLCYTSCGALDGTINMINGSTMKDRPDDPSHHEWTLLTRSYISLPPCTKTQTVLTVAVFKHEFDVLLRDVSHGVRVAPHQPEWTFLWLHHQASLWATNTRYITSEEEEEEEMLYLTTHTTHFIYGYMASDIW